MKIIRARHLGMCFGVRRAIALAFGAAARQPLTILGDLVHNESVLAQLCASGVRVRHEVSEVDTPTVMITAHGVSRQRLAAVRRLNARVLDATCPLVRSAHYAVTTLVEEGFHPVIVGVRDHVEVRGVTEDLAAFDVVVTEDDVACLRERPRFGIIAQTTQSIERVWHLAALIRHRFPDSEMRLVDTVCIPTKLRQQAADDLARRCDVIIVVGGATSNNTLELATACRRHCGRVFHVQRAADLRAEWLAGARVVGITAGTSTPEAVIDGVEARLNSLANNEVAA